MSWLTDNKDWLFSGAGVSIIAVIGGLFFKKKNKNKNDNTSAIDKFIDNEAKESTCNKVDKTIQILFVDDEKFDIIGVLKDAGWINTKRIKDITNLDSTDLRNANVIFVDVNGVGKQLFPKDQGLGLAEAIKRKYPDKHIVLYSAVSHHFHKALNVVDAILEKNADPYEFINILENYINNENTSKG
jgi:LPXTG-motif cell wall-anchored protein